MNSFATIARTTTHVIVEFTICLVLALLVGGAAAIGTSLVIGTARVYDAGSTGIELDNVGGFDIRGPGAPGFFTCDGPCGM